MGALVRVAVKMSKLVTRRSERVAVAHKAEGCGRYGIGIYMSSKNPTDTEATKVNVTQIYQVKRITSYTIFV